MDIIKGYEVDSELNLITDYAINKIKSGINNKFFKFNIKDANDHEILYNLLEKTNMSIHGLEKSFVSFLTTGSVNFNITKDSVKFIGSGKYDNDSVENDDNFNSKENDVIFKIENDDNYIDTSYLNFFKTTNNDITYIENYIKFSKVYSKSINDKVVLMDINRNEKNIEEVLNKLKNSLNNKEEILNQLLNDFKSQLKKLFCKAVNVRSNYLIDSEALENKIELDFISITDEDLEKDFYNTLEENRNKFFNENKNIIESFLKDNEEVKDSDLSKTESFFSTSKLGDIIRKEVEIKENEKELLEKSKNVREEVLEKTSNMEIDPKEFFSPKNSPLFNIKHD